MDTSVQFVCIIQCVWGVFWNCLTVGDTEILSTNLVFLKTTPSQHLLIFCQ